MSIFSLNTLTALISHSVTRYSFLSVICGNHTLIFLLCGKKTLHRVLINTIGYGKLSGLLRLFVSRNKRKRFHYLSDEEKQQVNVIFILLQLFLPHIFAKRNFLKFLIVKTDSLQKQLFLTG